jgi:pimeloyl-ACP methyl ester carboxylesterase
MPRPLSSAELYPSGRVDVSARHVRLSTGVSLRVVESGPPQGRPVVMLHGWGASAYMYRHALELLPPLGVRSIAVDLRGHGLSDKPTGAGSYTLDMYCADLDALLDVLSLPRVALIGQSMGGGIALHYARRNPTRVERLVLVSPVGLVPIAYLHALQVVPRSVVASFGRRLAPRPFVEFLLRHVAYGDPTKPTDRDVDEYWAPTQLPGFVPAARLALSEFEWGPLTDSEAESLSVSSAVILGTNDRLIRDAVPAARRLRSSEVYSVVAGHSALEENPGEVYIIVADVLTAS